ncbi:hypothetical protein [Parafrankia sp. EUN1f]|uniref:hypothetical protein n=1 Tax=Parafrankia sp. EUN1f TaxID=102897 RepID=UPI0001C43907|nr:hypothetical protein [Parafrankia sp. EUN1f]EFC86235.1 hypothetical protein FrEUN1fDRAFT_0672 [Parafrankia sp. EUN1f]
MFAPEDLARPGPFTWTSPLGTSDVVDMDDWIARYDAVGHYISCSSGTTGKSAMMIASERDMAWSRLDTVGVFAWGSGVRPERDRRMIGIAPTAAVAKNLDARDAQQAAASTLPEGLAAAAAFGGHIWRSTYSYPIWGLGDRQWRCRPPAGQVPLEPFPAGPPRRWRRSAPSPGPTPPMCGRPRGRPGWLGAAATSPAIIGGPRRSSNAPPTWPAPRHRRSPPRRSWTRPPSDISRMEAAERCRWPNAPWCAAGTAGADPALVRRAESARGYIAFLGADIAGLDQLTRAAREIENDPAARLTDVQGTWGALSNHAYATKWAERFTECEQAFRLAIEAAERAGAISTLSFLHIARSELFVRVGWLPEARSSLDLA